jgi:D-2-hydroxyacid dehydrogenase (NADP+)
MIGDISKREDELGGKTLVIVGMGRIGSRLATLAKAFDMRVIGTKRDPIQGERGLPTRLSARTACSGVLPEADFVALTCPLTPADRKPDRREGAGGDEALGLSDQRRARQGGQRAGAAGGAATRKRIAGAALDCVWEEPLPGDFGAVERVPNLLITPHTAGETRRYEDNVIDLLTGKPRASCGRGEARLKNQKNQFVRTEPARGVDATLSC